MSTSPHIFINNQSQQTYTLSVPFFNYMSIKPIFAKSIFSLKIPHSADQQTVCKLINQDTGQVFNFVLGVFGEIIKADKGLTIITIKNGLTGDFYGPIPLLYTQYTNNGILISKF